MGVGVVFVKWHKTIFALLYILVLFHIPLVTFFRPQIFAFNPILGFFPGFTYDESLQVTQRLLIYRLGTLAVSGGMIAAVSWMWQIRLNRKEPASVSDSSIPFLEIVLLAFFIPMVLMTLMFSDRFGFSSSEQFIRQKLVGNYKTAHFEIIYPAGSVKHERIEQLGRLHEYYYSTLTHVLNIQFQKPLTSFLYFSPEEKGRLIGAGRTDIAKPWLHQIHLNLSDVEAGLKHEMAHVLASDFGWSPFKISRNSGIVEGFAVAVGDNTWYDEPLDRAASLVYAAGINPDMESLFSFSGFIKVNSGTSYVLAGSFCKFLIDSYGIEKFKNLYRSGDFLLTYNRPLPSLLSDWRTIIRGQQLTLQDSVKAKYFFRRPSIFGKECARVIANINIETKGLIVQHEFEKALTSAEQSLALSKTPEAAMQKSTALFEMRMFKDAAGFIEAQMRDTLYGTALLPLHLRLGDAYWAMDSLNRAKQEYKIMTSIHLSAWYEEACLLRLESLKDRREEQELKKYFVYSMEDTVRVDRLSKLFSPLARYLLARELAAQENFQEACTMFEHLGIMHDRSLEFFRLYRLGRVYFSLLDWEKARMVFQSALPDVPTASLEIEMKDWIERCRIASK
jgi:tetratricopeptide (TPR) repeat protein